MKILIPVLGAGFLLQGLVWIAAPRMAATNLGMPLLDGLGRSTQIGDFASSRETGIVAPPAGVAGGSK